MYYLRRRVFLGVLQMGRGRGGRGPMKRRIVVKIAISRLYTKQMLTSPSGGHYSHNIRKILFKRYRYFIYHFLKNYPLNRNCMCFNSLGNIQVADQSTYYSITRQKVKGGRLLFSILEVSPRALCGKKYA